ncbi:MAG: SusC/RagA family TonB-linked outer membrane protein [Bacteroidales bacterium]|nr:SusC/RagA family TonB-linked outer membrane protein [Bacteroidales bacterium]
MRKKLILVLFLMSVALTVFAQNSRKFTGTVTDVLGEPLIGAAVLVEGTTEGAVTDFDGKYELVTTVANPVLRFTSMGYRDAVVTPAADQTVVDVVLEDDSTLLEGTVVTALGIRRSEKALSYNVQQVDGEKLTNVKTANVMSSLAGKIAGVNINTSSAGVGGATRVVMRGPKSLSQSNQALYVIDGVPINNRNNGEVSNGIYSSQPGSEGISDLNPEDIESISVLSGPAAAALYGSAAAQGVIMITTKKGKEGHISVTVANNTSFSNAFIMPEFQNTYGNRPGETKSWGEEGAGTNYDPKNFFQTGYDIQNSIALTTGNEKNQTYVSIGTDNARGIITGNTYDRYNAAFRNTTSMLDDKLTLDFSLSVTKEKDANLMSQGQYFNPLTSVYLFPRGEDFNAVRAFELYDASREVAVQNWNFGNDLQMQNPYWVAKRMVRSNNKLRYMLSTSLKYEIAKWINITGRLRWDDASTKFEDKRYASTLTLFTAGSIYGFYGHSNTADRSLYGDIMANINHNWEKVSLSANIGTSYNLTAYDVSGFQGGLRGPSNIFWDTAIDHRTAHNDNRPIFAKTRHNIQAVFANVELGWNSLVYLTLTGRNDWDSALAGTNHESFFYPSVGVSTILSKLLGLPSWWNFLKVRGSWASVGSAISPGITTPWTYNYASSSYNYSTNTYKYPDSFYPEKTNSWEVGIQSQWFDGDLTLDATWYRSNTYKQTFLRPLSGATGYSSEYYQAGNVQNVGIELALGFKHTWGNFGWSTNFTYSANRNKIVELYADNKDEVISKGGLNGIGVILKTGGTMGDIYDYSSFEVDHEGNIALDASGNIIRKTLTNPVYRGSVLPKGNFGWNNEFTFKGVNVGALVTARVGGIVMSQTQAILDEYGVSKASAEARAAGGFRVNTGVLSAEQYYSVVGGSNPIWQDYIYSADNVRIQEAHIGYNFPEKWLGGKSLYVGLTANNILMIYKKAPFDPESVASTGTYYQGFDYFMQPSLRSWGFNVRFKF